MSWHGIRFLVQISQCRMWGDSYTSCVAFFLVQVSDTLQQQLETGAPHADVWVSMNRPVWAVTLVCV